MGKLGWHPNCAYCGKPLISWKHEYGVDMHEAFITRGDIQGRPDLAPRIMVRENCGLVHHGDCHRRVQTKEGQRKAAEHLLYWVGTDAVLSWLDGLEDDFVGTTITEAINLIVEVEHDSKSKS